MYSICVHSFGGGLWRKLYDCSLHHMTTSQCSLKCAVLLFSSTYIRLAEIESGTFRPPVWGVRGHKVSRIGPFENSPMGSYSFPIDNTYGLSITVLSYLVGSKSASVRPTRIRLQSYCLVERQKSSIYLEKPFHEYDCYKTLDYCSLRYARRLQQSHADRA